MLLRLVVPGFYLAALLSLSAAETFAERLQGLQNQLAADPTNTALIFQVADWCHDEGARDNAKAVVQAEKYFRQLLQLEPRHAHGMALLGSTLTLKARDTFWPGTRLSLVKEGNKLMDAAVKLEPGNLQVRLVRALNNIHMPHFLERDTIARDDLAWLWQQAQERPHALSMTNRQEIALQYGIALRKARRPSEATAVWRSGHALNPESELASTLEKQLKTK